MKEKGMDKIERDKERERRKREIVRRNRQY